MKKKIVLLITIISASIIPLYAIRKKLPNTEIIDAAARNDLMQVRSLIVKKNVNVNVQDKEGKTALHATSSPDIVFELMISGADPNLTTKEKLTPLLSAILNSHRDKAIVLLECGASPNTMHQKKTPLMLATEQQDYELVKELVKAGAKVSSTTVNYAKNHNQRIASFLDHYRMAKNSKGASNTLDKGGLSPMHYATLRNDHIEFDAHICAGGKLNIQSSKGKTPLHLAVEYNLPSMTEKLLELQAKLRIQDYNGKTPLHYAAQTGNQTIVSMLQNHGAPCSMVDNQGHTPLSLAQKHHHNDIAVVLSNTQTKEKHL